MAPRNGTVLLGLDGRDRGVLMGLVSPVAVMLDSISKQGRPAGEVA